MCADLQHRSMSAEIKIKHALHGAIGKGNCAGRNQRAY